MTYSTSLGRKFALLLALLLGLPTLVCGGILMHVHGMRRDANRLLEETRESALTNELLVHIETVSSLLAYEGGESAATALEDLARDHLEAVQPILAQIERAHPRGDPSRAEHQSEESRLVHSMITDLGAVTRRLEQEGQAGTPAILEGLERARRTASVLREETFHESVLANQDVGVRARASRRYIAATLGTMGVVSLVALFLLYRVVLSPLRRLRRGAERLQGGDLEHRIDILATDEIGDLGRAFNAMADEIGKSHGELERKIDARTRELISAARLVDVGVLAAGVAHEVNNPLASIASCGEGLLRRLETRKLDPAEEKDYLETIVSEAYRTREITSQLLDLARPGNRTVEQLDVQAVFEQAAKLTRHLLAKKQLQLHVDVAAELPALTGDPGELLQMLLNLILNARDASPAGAEIRLRARAEARGQVWEVEDRGAGIAEGDVVRIFDPFFTTKEPGEGTGLGLSLAAAIVDRHGGAITAANREGGGARIAVRLPAKKGVEA